MAPRSNQGRKRVLFLIAIAIVLATPVSFGGSAQVAARTLSGTVTAASGSRIPNAHISIKNTVNGDTVSATAKEDGSYKVPSLLPGNYEVTASAPGFAAARTTVTMSTGSDALANFVLEPANEEVGSSTVSGVVSSKSVTELPLNGRSASDLAALEPGVATARTQSSGQAQRGFGTQMTISGARPRQNDSRLDGISVNDYANGHLAARSASIWAWTQSSNSPS